MCCTGLWEQCSLRVDAVSNGDKSHNLYTTVFNQIRQVNSRAHGITELAYDKFVTPLKKFQKLFPPWAQFLVRGLLYHHPDAAIFIHPFFHFVESVVLFRTVQVTDLCHSLIC